MPLSEPTIPAVHIAVVIPTHKAHQTVLGVIERIGPEVASIYVVDDCCPAGSGDVVQANCRDPRVCVIRHDVNQGVGGAVMTGYNCALTRGADIIVKIDSDGQMDPALIPFFVRPILQGHADYTKGNRFFDLASLEGMPLIRKFGNAMLSLMTKFSTGYWNLFDPTNGYTAIHARVAELLPEQRINKRYLFESDVMYYLSVFRAVIQDIPMRGHYGTEISGIKITSIVGPFLWMHAAKFLRRVLAQYFVRDFSFASICLALGVPLTVFGFVQGVVTWSHALATNEATPLGTVMLIVLTLVLGVQFLLTFFAADIAAVPRLAIHPLIPERVVRPLNQYSSPASPPQPPA